MRKFSHTPHLRCKDKILKTQQNGININTHVSSENPVGVLRPAGSVGFVAWPRSALFWSGFGWVVCICVFVCMLSFGACGVTEVSGLWLLLCEAALHPPAALNPWCGACTYLNNECKFTTLVKTSSSENTRQNTKRNTMGSTAFGRVFSLNNHSSRTFYSRTVLFQNKGSCSFPAIQTDTTITKSNHPICIALMGKQSHVCLQT